MNTPQDRKLINEFFTRLRLAQYQFFMLVDGNWTRTPLEVVTQAVFNKGYESVKIQTGKLQHGTIYAVIDLETETLSGFDMLVDWSYNDVHVDEEIQFILDAIEMEVEL